VTELVTIAPGRLDDLLVAASAGSLYALLDACDEPRVPQQARALGARAFSLYQDTPDADLWAIGPYLAWVDSATLEWIQSSLWGAPWGIFAISAAGLDALGNHFRKFVHVRSPENEDWYFRFYDPRVIGGFLPTCDASGLAGFFGPITTFAWTDQTTREVVTAARKFMSTTPVVNLRRSP
jgi:hypothetical protein